MPIAISLMLAVESAPEAADWYARAAGADGAGRAVRDHEVPWGVHRQGGFLDPFGHVWHVGDRSPLARFPGAPS